MCKYLLRGTLIVVLSCIKEHVHVSELGGC